MKFVWRNTHVFEEGGWKLDSSDKEICEKIIKYAHYMEKSALEECKSELSDISINISDMITWRNESIPVILRLKEKIIKYAHYMEKSALEECKSELSDISINISDMITWRNESIPVILRLKDEDSVKIFMGLEVNIKIPRSKLVDMINEKYGVGFVAHIPSIATIDDDNIPYIYRWACDTLDKKQFGYDEEVVEVKTDSSSHQSVFNNNNDANNLEDNGYAIGKNFTDSKMIMWRNNQFEKIDIKSEIHTINDYDLNKVVSYYSSSTQTIHITCNTNDLCTKSEDYRYKLVETIKNRIMVRSEAKIITKSGKVIDAEYECSMPHSRNSRELRNGIAFKYIHSYSRNIKHENIFLKNGSNYESTEPFTLYVAGFVPYNLMQKLGGMLRKISSITSNESCVVSVNPNNIIRYGGEINVGDKRLKYSPAYEDLDIYDQYDIDHYTDPNELLEKHYNFGELLYGDSSDYDDELISLNEWLMKYGGI